MFTDDLRFETWSQAQPKFMRAAQNYLTPRVLAEAAAACGHTIRRNPLNLANLVWLGLASASLWSTSFTQILTVTFELLADAPGNRSMRSVRAKGARPTTPKRSRHDPRRDDPTRVSEEAFVKARARMPWEFWLTLISLLADRFAREHADLIRWNQFRLLALDGSLINLPRWQALRDHFGAARNQKGGRIPQARMLMLQFPLARIPWRIALEPKRQAEKTLAAPLIKHLRANDLLLMDRGFWSFGLFCQVQDQQAFFAIRKVGQAHLKVLRRLGPKDTLVQYAPKDKKWRRQGLPESLELRCLKYQFRGFRDTALITNVTDPKLISYEQWIGLTASESAVVLHHSLYHRRWEIETTFRELKIDQGMNHLRGRTPGSIRYEIASHVVLYLLIRWLLAEAAVRSGVDPLRLSFTAALGVIETMRVTLVQSSPSRVRRELLPRLLDRLASHRVPHRPGRHYPRPRDNKIRNLGNGRKQLPSKLVA